MLLSRNVFKLVYVAARSLEASVEVDDRSITIELNQNRPFVETDSEVLDSTFERLDLDQSYIFRSASYHYYIREEAFR